MTTFVCEDFYSISGESVLTGVPSVFVRFFGCNMPGCPGFGQPDPSDKSTYHNIEIIDIIHLNMDVIHLKVGVQNLKIIVHRMKVVTNYISI